MLKRLALLAIPAVLLFTGCKSTLSSEGGGGGGGSSGNWQLVGNAGAYASSENCFLSTGEYLFIASGDTICRSTDGGMTWSRIGLGAYISSISGNSQTLFAAATNPDNSRTILRSQDNGDSWVPVRNGIPDSCSIQSIFATPAVVLVTTQKYVYPDYQTILYRSQNNGQSWVKTTSGLPNQMSSCCLAADGNVLYAGTDQGIYKSTDNGAHWTMDRPTDEIGRVYSMSICGPDIFVVGGNGNIYSTPVNGTGWKLANLLAYSSSSYSRQNPFLYDGTNLFFSSYSMVSLSKDLGETSTALTNGFSSVRIIGLVTVDGYLTAIGYDGSVQRLSLSSL